MNKRECTELSRNLKPDRSAISRLYGCYVNEAKEVISTFEQSMGMITDEECGQYHNLLKKVLSGTVGRNLLDISFTAGQMMEGFEYGVLTKLRDSKLDDDTARMNLYESIIPTVSLKSNYLILLAHNAYDVPYRSKTDVLERDNGKDNQVFSYILCCICPVKKSKPGLGYNHIERNFSMEIGEWLVSAPQIGFMFPAFDERSTNIGKALFYTKDIKDNHQEFIKAVFHTDAPTPAAEQKSDFEAILEDSLEDECTFEVVQAIYGELNALIDAHKEGKYPHPLEIERSTIDEVLERIELSEEHLAKFDVAFDVAFGSNQKVLPENLINKKCFELESFGLNVKIDAARSYIVQPKMIDGAKCLVIRIEDGITADGIPVLFGKEFRCDG